MMNGSWKQHTPYSHTSGQPSFVEPLVVSHMALENAHELLVMAVHALAWCPKALVEISATRNVASSAVLLVTAVCAH